MPTDIDKLQIEIEADSAQAGSAIDRLTASLQRLQSAVGNNTALQKTSQQVKAIAKAPSLTRLEKELSKVEKQAVKDGDSLVELQKKLEELQGYKGVGNRLTQADTASKIKETTAQIRQLSGAVDTADAKIRELRQSIRDVRAGSIPTVQAPKASTTSKTASSNIPQATAQIRQAATATQGVGSAAAQVKANLDGASTSAKKFASEAKKAASSGTGGFASLGKSIKGMVTSFAIFGAIFSITGAIGDSFARMAQENEGVNKTLSEIKSSLQYVTDALAAAILPILQAIAPIVTFILDVLAAILNTIARIIAFFTGQDSVVQAQKQQVDFAGSLDGTADSMDNVTSAAKKMYKALLPIDELNIFEDNSSGGGSIGGLGDLRFEEVAVDPINLPDTIKSPSWSPNPVLAPEFAPVTVPAMEGVTLRSPQWVPTPVPSPVFESVAMPEWATSPLPVPEWESNPIPAPVLDLEPVRSGLADMETQFSNAWSNVAVKTEEGAAATNKSLSKIAEQQRIFTTDSVAQFGAWAAVNKQNFDDVTSYIQAITPPAFSNVISTIGSFAAVSSAAIKTWGTNIDSNARTALQYIPDAVASALTSAGNAFGTWIATTSSGFASWAKNVIQNAGAAAEGLFQNIVSGLSAAWKQFTGFIKGIGEKISNWWSANKSWAAPVAAGAVIAGVTIGAIVLSGGSALAAVPALATIPALANGGVLTSPQVVLAGEYSNARSNPEIVTPQNLMYDTFRDAQDTDVVVNAIMAGVQQIVRAIQDSNVEVYVDGDGTAQQNRRNRMYGKTLQYI